MQTYNSLRQLMCAGFVDEVRLTPNGHFFDLHSFYKHVEAVRVDLAIRVCRGEMLA